MKVYLKRRNISARTSVLIWFMLVLTISTLDIVRHFIYGKTFDTIKVKWLFFSMLSTIIVTLLTIAIYKGIRLSFSRSDNEKCVEIGSYLMVLIAFNIVAFSYRFFAPYLLEILQIDKKLNYNVGIIPFLIISLIFSLMWLIVYYKIKLSFHDRYNE